MSLFNLHLEEISKNGNQLKATSMNNLVKFDEEAKISKSNLKKM